MTIWLASHGAAHIQPLSGILYRLVESQEQIATLGYVDTLEEQALLEDILETAKPPYRVTDSERGTEEFDALHYLLKTPFRYPPLQWGSRFGRTHEPGIFYGGGSIDVTLVESAYYRLIFWFSMSAEPVKDSLRTSHTMFSVAYSTQHGVRLQQPPFSEHQAKLTHASSYQHTQALGSSMREAGVQAFEYCSARDPSGGLCVALFTPEAFSERTPGTLQQWFCEVSASAVSFKQLGKSDVLSFRLEDFLEDGKLPLPA